MFYFAYIGNKRSEFKHLEPFLKDLKFTTVVEPFCGSCSTSLNLFKNNKDLNFHFNDIDKSLINLLKDIKINGSFKYFEYVQDKLKDLTKEEHKKYIENYRLNPDNLKLYFYYNKVYNYRKGLYPRGKKIKSLQNKNHLIYDELFKKALLTTGDFTEILNKYKNDSQALVYIDPPYLDSFNAYYASYENEEKTILKKKYEIIDNTKIFIDILKFLKSAKCKIIIILNDNSMIRHLFKKYIIYEYPKNYSFTQPKGKKENLEYYKKYTKHLIISNIR